MIDLLKSVILGIVEGITEWLPISSTGHIILADEFLIKKNVMDMWFKVIVACIPAALLVPFNDKIDEIFYNYRVVAAMLIIYGILFIVIERENRNRKPVVSNMNEMSYKTALLIGVFQMLAVIPGTSRSGATILGAILLGVSRVTAAEFSFYLAVPVMFGASRVKLVKFGLGFTGSELAVLAVGMITAFLVSIAAIKFLIGYIKKRDFTAFGYYRIVLGIVVLLYFALV